MRAAATAAATAALSVPRVGVDRARLADAMESLQQRMQDLHTRRLRQEAEAEAEAEDERRAAAAKAAKLERDKKIWHMRGLLAHPALPVEVITAELKTCSGKHRTTLAFVLQNILTEAVALEINTAGMSAREREGDPKVKKLIGGITSRFLQLPKHLQFYSTAEMPACDTHKPCDAYWAPRWPPNLARHFLQHFEDQNAKHAERVQADDQRDAEAALAALRPVIPLIGEPEHLALLDATRADFEAAGALDLMPPSVRAEPRAKPRARRAVRTPPRSDDALSAYLRTSEARIQAMVGGHTACSRALIGAAQQAVASGRLSKHTLPLNLLLAHNWESLTVRTHLPPDWRRLVEHFFPNGVPSEEAALDYFATSETGDDDYLRSPASSSASTSTGRTSPRMHPYSPPPPCPPMYALPCGPPAVARPRPVRSAAAAAAEPFAAFDERPYTAPGHFEPAAPMVVLPRDDAWARRK